MLSISYCRIRLVSYDCGDTPVISNSVTGRVRAVKLSFALLGHQLQV